MAAFNVLHEGTGCIYKGEEKPVMKCSFLQALSAFGVNQRAKELGINPGLQVKASVQARENDLLVQAIDTRAVRGNKSARQRGSKFTYHSW